MTHKLSINVFCLQLTRPWQVPVCFCTHGSQEAQETSQLFRVLRVSIREKIKEDILILLDTSTGKTHFSVPISPPYIPREILAEPGGHHPTRISLIRQFSTNLPYHDCLWLRDLMSQSAMGKVTGSFPSMHTAQGRVTLCRKNPWQVRKENFLM